MTQPTVITESDRQLYRLTDINAAAEATAALHNAATQDILVLADAVLRDPYDDDARDRLRDDAASPEFLSLLPNWIRELREIASLWPDSGACTSATALKLWLWTMKHFRTSEAAQAVDELADALVPLLAARCLALEVIAQDDELRRDLCHVYSAHASASAASLCAELVFGYRRHLVWDAEGCATCFAADDLDDLEAFIPGIASGARTSTDVIEADGAHPAKRGPCANFNGLETFMRLRNRLDACLTGARLAKDRAAVAISRSA